MQRRTVGMLFICIAAFLYGVRYITAAIFGSNVSSWDSSLFKAMLNYIGNGPLILSVLSLIAGILYLIVAEFGESLKGSFEQIKRNWNEFDE
ncbi:hypothetical protein SD71_08545 [Cohnella kolymensis]|uniref:Uncharacterized protein n=1 Tax=Cohnella kolymensis TaxID=1590652 RepID=A0ABR5A6B7_9BACL|nr:hypothetical protein [Cohnella kolymensis]KIL36308.1 hypothetical protein SD71_08545 [Cohnella kolymensis]